MEKGYLLYIVKGPWERHRTEVNLSISIKLGLIGPSLWAFKSKDFPSLCLHKQTDE